MLSLDTMSIFWCDASFGRVYRLMLGNASFFEMLDNNVSGSLLVQMHATAHVQ